MPEDGGVSTSHSKIELREGRLLYTGLGSSNGTWHNGDDVKAHNAIELTSGDNLILGNTQIEVEFTVHGPK